MEISGLEEKIKNNNVEEAKKIIEEIGYNKNTEQVPLLIHYLGDTDNHILRNAIAIALSDIGNIEAVEPIIRIIRHPKTIGARGTLLYALQEFDCSRYGELLTDLLFEDSFEVSRQSFLLLESNADNIPTEIKQKCIEKIQAKIESLRDEIAFLSEALELFNDKDTSITKG